MVLFLLLLPLFPAAYVQAAAVATYVVGVQAQTVSIVASYIGVACLAHLLEYGISHAESMHQWGWRNEPSLG